MLWWNTDLRGLKLHRNLVWVLLLTVYRGKLIANHFSELQMCVDCDGSEEDRMGILFLLIYSEKTPKKKLSLSNE